jgi:hypothetical protein
MGIQYNCSRFASSQCLLILPVTPHVRKRWKRNIQVNGGKNSARGPYVSFLETRNAQGDTFIVSWIRNTRKIRVCFLCFHFPVFRLRPYPTLQRRGSHRDQRSWCQVAVTTSQNARTWCWCVDVSDVATCQNMVDVSDATTCQNIRKVSEHMYPDKNVMWRRHTFSSEALFGRLVLV